MRTRTKLIGVSAIALALGIATYGFNALSEETGHDFGPPFMRHGSGPMSGIGMGHGPGMMGMNHGSTTAAEMRTIHELFANHDRIKRTVTNLPDGIRTVTESDDPRIAELIKTHVVAMRERVEAGNDPGLPIESPALHSIFRDKDKIRTTYETTTKGVVVTQTSADPATVAALQQHASEVSDFVKGGMAAMRSAMMRNGGMMAGPMMHGRMTPGGMMGGPMVRGMGGPMHGGAGEHLPSNSR
jgi:hypothetical protein